MGGRARVPFAERGGMLRGVLDLAAGRYPAFLFGGPVGRLLPVFHFHDVTPGTLEPKLQHLAEHGYRTVTCEAIDRLVHDGAHPGPRAVVLCFDDAHASLWSVAAPLLRRYGFRAVTFAIPGRIRDAAATRPTIDGSEPPSAPGLDEFVNWAELRALHAGGVIDVQCHTYSHSSIFCGDSPVGFVTPAWGAEHPLSRPLISPECGGAYLDPGALGAPLFLQRSRMSDAVRYRDDPAARERCQAHVRARGGEAAFRRPGWEAELRALAGAPGEREAEGDRRRAIYAEIDAGRAVLCDRLRTRSIRHLCFPWGVAGVVAREAARATGFRTAFSERLFGLRAVKSGDDPLRLMRLNAKFVTRLPRRQRRRVFVKREAGRSAPAGGGRGA